MGSLTSFVIYKDHFAIFMANILAKVRLERGRPDGS